MVHVTSVALSCFGVCCVPRLYPNCVIRLHLPEPAPLPNCVIRCHLPEPAPLQPRPFAADADANRHFSTRGSISKLPGGGYEYPLLHGDGGRQSLGVLPETVCGGVLPSFQQFKADLTYSTAFYGCLLFFGICQIPYYAVVLSDSAYNQKWSYSLRLFGYCGLNGAVSLSVWIWSKWMNWGSVASSKRLSWVLWGANALSIAWTTVVVIEIFVTSGDLGAFFGRRNWLYVSYLLMTSFTLVTLVMVGPTIFLSPAPLTSWGSWNPSCFVLAVCIADFMYFVFFVPQLICFNTIQLYKSVSKLVVGGSYAIEEKKTMLSNTSRTMVVCSISFSLRTVLLVGLSPCFFVDLEIPL